MNEKCCERDHDSDGNCDRHTDMPCQCGGLTITNPHSPLCDKYRLVMAGLRSDFDYVGDFHKKFGLPSVTHDGAQPRPIAKDVALFRLKFLLEELTELADAYGYVLSYELDRKPGDPVQDVAAAADALVDLVYVAHGSGHYHGLPWAELYAEVQRANISKERCTIGHLFTGDEDLCTYIEADHSECRQPRVKHSKRGSINDVIKPEGWKPPNIEGILAELHYPPHHYEPCDGEHPVNDTCFDPHCWQR